MLAAVRKAHDITVSSYFLRQGPLQDALLRAARRHASVHVRLDGTPFGGSASNLPDSRRAVDALRALHADAQFVHLPKTDGPALHMKAVVCDGVAFLDDRNWTAGRDTILRDDTAGHVKAIEAAALRQRAATVGALSLSKAGALAAEARMLRATARHGEVDVETETLGKSRVSHALRDLLSQHVRCRVLVSAQAFSKSETTQKAAKSLARAGADVRIVRSTEKFAVTPAHAWIGSANASAPFPHPDDIEWSLTSRDERIVRAMHRRFDAGWRDSKPIS